MMYHTTVLSFHYQIQAEASVINRFPAECGAPQSKLKSKQQDKKHQGQILGSGAGVTLQREETVRVSEVQMNKNNIRAQPQRYRYSSC